MRSMSYTAPKAVTCTSGEDAEPLVGTNWLAYAVSGAQLLDLDQVRDALRLAPRHRLQLSSSNDAVLVSGMFGCRQISTGNEITISE